MKNIKKSQMAYQEFLLISFSLVLLGLSIFLMFLSTNKLTTSIEISAPEITYKYPSIFIYSFLNMPVDFDDISKEDSLKKYSFDKNKIYYIKDIIMQANSDSKNLIKNYRQKYLDEVKKISSLSNKDSLYLFNLYSNSNFNYDDLIKFDFYLVSDYQFIENNLYSIKNKNYIYILPTSKKDEIFEIKFYQKNLNYVAYDVGSN